MVFTVTGKTKVNAKEEFVLSRYIDLFKTGCSVSPRGHINYGYE